MRKMIIAVAAIALAGCASMDQATPEDKQQFYAADPEVVHQAIADWMFDTGVTIIDEAEGRVRGEHENASVMAGAMTGGSVVTRINMQYREQGDGTLVRASMVSDISGRQTDALVESYQDTFAMIGDYIDRQP